MKDGGKLNFYISVVGLGVVAGALSSVIKIPEILILSIGMGLMVGGVFRAIGQIERKLAKNEAAGKPSQ